MHLEPDHLVRVERERHVLRQSQGVVGLLRDDERVAGRRIERSLEGLAVEGRGLGGLRRHLVEDHVVRRGAEQIVDLPDVDRADVPERHDEALRVLGVRRDLDGPELDRERLRADAGIVRHGHVAVGGRGVERHGAAAAAGSSAAAAAPAPAATASAPAARAATARARPAAVVAGGGPPAGRDDDGADEADESKDGSMGSAHVSSEETAAYAEWMGLHVTTQPLQGAYSLLQMPPLPRLESRRGVTRMSASAKNPARISCHPHPLAVEQRRGYAQTQGWVSRDFRPFRSNPAASMK